MLFSNIYIYIYYTGGLVAEIVFNIIYRYSLDELTITVTS